MYKFIYHPITKKKININSKNGLFLIKNYISRFNNNLHNQKNNKFNYKSLKGGSNNKNINLVYMAKPGYGGWVSFTSHLSRKHNLPLFKINLPYLTKFSNSIIVSISTMISSTSSSMHPAKNVEKRRKLIMNWIFIQSHLLILWNIDS